MHFIMSKDANSAITSSSKKQPIMVKRKLILEHFSDSSIDDND